MKTSAIAAIWSVVLLGVCAVVVVEELPPKIRMDWYVLRADRLAAEDPKAAFDTLRKVVVLQEEHGLTLPSEVHITYAKVALAAGAAQEAIDAVGKFLREEGRPPGVILFPIQDRVDAIVQGKTEAPGVASASVQRADVQFYREVLELLDEAKQVQAWIETRQTCAGQPRGAECWMEVSGQPGCYVWNPHFDPGETVTWTGKCYRGRVQGGDAQEGPEGRQGNGIHCHRGLRGRQEKRPVDRAPGGWRLSERSL